jgi:hypothetical protein
LIEKKIQASERIKFGRIIQNVEEIWTHYFDHKIFGVRPEQFIVEMTWCNPRDIVVLLGNAAAGRYQEKYFSEQLIFHNLPDYSRHCWQEREDELSSIYSQSEIAVIKALLRTWKTSFKLSDLENRIRERSRVDKATQQFCKVKKLDSEGLRQLLRNLYWIGIIGQSYHLLERQTKRKLFSERWVYRGDYDFDSDGTFMIHRALWSELRLEAISGDCFRLGALFQKQDPISSLETVHKPS